MVEPLREGRLCLTSIIEAAKVVTAENWETVLPRFYGLSKREAMEVVAALQPHPAPPARSVVTAVPPAPAGLDAVLPQRAPPPVPAALDLCDAPAPSDARHEATRVAGWPVNQRPSPIPTVAPPRPLEVVPLTAEQSRLHATVSSRFLRKLEAARDALSHARPDATPGEILEAGLDLLLAQAAKRRGLVEKPRKEIRPAKTEPQPAKADHIPAHVRREVWRRDGGRCQWSLASGGICGSTRHLELDHVRPRSRGGTSTLDNLRILCRSHNDLAARLALGDEKMDQFTFGLSATPRRSRGGRANRCEPPTTPPP